MSWKDILKRTKKIIPAFEKLIESIMTDTPKSGRQIQDMLYNKIDEINSSRERRYSLSRKHIPTGREISMYFRANKNKYGTKILNSKGKEVEKESGSTTRYYYKL